MSSTRPGTADPARHTSRPPWFLALVTIVLAGALAPVALAAVAPPDTTSPAPPAALDQEFTTNALAMGIQHWCFLPGDGTVKCQGVNTFGQLGDGTTTDPGRYVTVVAGPDGGTLSSVTAITVGFTHTCAVLADGTARCWGDNAPQTDPIGIASAGGQLGDGTTESSPTPVTVVGLDGAGALSGVVAIDAGFFRTCALLAGGTVACWGDGQSTPALIATAEGPPLSGVTAISSADFHTCAVLADTTVRCWGRNTSGELGNEVTTDSTTAVRVGGGEAGILTGVTAIATGGGFTQDAGGGHSCALMADGTVWCWGNNEFGQIGQDIPLGESPVIVPSRVVTELGVDFPLTDAIAVTAGWGVSCALLADTSVACWGDLNRFPIQVPSAPGSTTPLTRVVGIVTGDRICGLMDTGTVRCWFVGVEGNPLPLDGVVLVEPSPEPSASPQATAGASQPPAQPSPGSSAATGPTGGGGGSGGGGTGAPAAAVPVSFRDAVPTPKDITLDPIVVAQTVIIAAAIVLFVPFPGVLFNNTLEANYPEIVGRVRGVRRRLRRAIGLPPASSEPAEVADATDPAARSDAQAFWSTARGVTLFVLLTALLASFLDPTFGPDTQSLATFVGLVLGLVVTLIAVCLPIAIEFRRKAIPFVVRALPGTLLVGVACVLISRLTSFQPGYLYGLVVGVAARELSIAAAPRTTAIAMGSAIAAAVVAWFAMLFIPTEPNPGWLVSTLQTMLATIVVAGLEGVAIGMLPVRFLAGEAILGWNRFWWGLLFGAAVAGFLLILVNPASGYLADSSRTPMLTIVALLLFFGIGSLAFWAYFRFRRPPEVASASS